MKNVDVLSLTFDDDKIRLGCHGEIDGPLSNNFSYKFWYLLLSLKLYRRKRLKHILIILRELLFNLLICSIYVL